MKMAKAFLVFIVFQLVKPSLPPDSIWRRVLSTAAINHPWRPLQEIAVTKLARCVCGGTDLENRLRPYERWKPVSNFREKRIA
jgi:hypothetical protein